VVRVGDTVGALLGLVVGEDADTEAEQALWPMAEVKPNAHEVQEAAADNEYELLGQREH
jgi:hypothetical protein